MTPEEKKVLMQTFSREEEDRQRRIDKKSLAPYELKAQQMERQEKKQKRSGGGGGGGASDLRELQLGYDLDPKVMMRNFGEYAKGGKVKKMADGGIPKNTFLTKDALEKASSSMTAQRMRERDSINKDRKNAINKNKPGAPYYQPYDNAALGISTDNPDEAVARAKGQGKYVRDNSTAGSRFQEDEGVFAPTARMANMLMKGSSVKDATDMNNILGDKELMKGTRKAGQDAVTSYKGAMENQKEYGMKKGGKVKKMASGGKVSSASSRGDGCAQRGKTKGRMV